MAFRRADTLRLMVAPSTIVRRLAMPVLVVWPALTLAGWGLARIFGGPESLADCAATAGILMIGACLSERARQWRERRRRTDH